jgi:glycosyltransferase involved in cell wall biosynthesis
VDRETLRRRLWFLRPAVRAARRVARTVARAVQRPLSVVLRRFPNTRPPAWLLVPLARTATDIAVIERIIDSTERRSRTGRTERHLLEIALTRRSALALDRNENREALDWIERTHDAFGSTPNTLTYQAIALRRLGRLDESRVVAEEAASADPPWCPALAHLASLHQQQGDQRTAVSYWQRLLAASETTPAQLRWAWIGAFRARELQLAARIADRLATATNRSPDAVALRAATDWALGEHEQADRAVEALLSDRRIRDRCARMVYLSRTGRSEPAAQQFATVPAGRCDLDTITDLVQGLREDGHLRLALEVASRAAQAHPDELALQQAVDLTAGEVRVYTAVAPALPATGAPARASRRGGAVLHVVGRTVPYAASGYAVRTHHTVRAQRALGIDAQVVSQLGFPWEEGKDVPAVETIDEVPHHRLPIPASASRPLPLDERLAHNVEALGELAERLRPSVLHTASDFRNGLLGAIVADRLGIPMIYEMRGFWEETWLSRRGEDAIDRDMYQLRRAREIDVAQRAAHVFTLADTMRDALVDRGLDPTKISLAPNAVNPADFPEPVRDDRLARRLGIGDDEVVVGYVSSFVGYEGIHVLIDAIAQVRAGGRKVRGLLVGDGIVRSELERQATMLGLEDTVVFTGRVPHAEVAAYYGLIDVFVVPRTNARVCRLVSPLKPFEAMAASRAVVVSGTPVLRSIVEDGVTGLVFEPEDPEDLARRISELADDAGPSRAARRGSAGARAREPHLGRERRALPRGLPPAGSGVAGSGEPGSGEGERDQGGVRSEDHEERGPCLRSDRGLRLGVQPVHLAADVAGLRLDLAAELAGLRLDLAAELVHLGAELVGEVVEVTFGGDVCPADRWEVADEGQGMLLAEHAYEPVVQPVTRLLVDLHPASRSAEPQRASARDDAARPPDEAWCHARAAPGIAWLWIPDRSALQAMRPR